MPAAKKIIVELAQTQAGDAYRLPLEIGIADRIEKIEMTRKEQQFEIAADKEPASVASRSEHLDTDGFSL